MAYQCYPDKWSSVQLAAIELAGKTIQQLADKWLTTPEGQEVPNFRWLETRYQILFAHMVFIYKNKVFAVYVDLDGAMPVAHANRLREAAERWDLVPCVFSGQISGRFNPWGLWHLVTQRPVDPRRMADDTPAEMSQWERRALSIDIAVDVLKKEGYEIDSFCTIPEIDPQVVFKDQEGRICRCLVREWIGDDPAAPSAEDFRTFADDRPPMQVRDGYFIGISIASLEPVVRDRAGEIIPLDRRFKAHDYPLYRSVMMGVEPCGPTLIHRRITLPPGAKTGYDPL